MLKTCSMCCVQKQITEFYFNRTNGKTRSECKVCGIKSNMKARKVKYSRAWFARQRSRIKERALKRGYQFNLDVQELVDILSKDCCYYCEEQISGTKTVDRVNNRIGYNITNCVLCCARCNRRKNDLTIEDITNFYNKMKKTAF